MLEQLIRDQARGLYKQAEMLRMMRLAQEGKLTEYLVSREVRKVQSKINRKMRSAIGLK